MRRDDFLPLLEQSSALAYNFLMSVSKQLHQADAFAGALHIFEVEKRLARLLLYIYSKKQTVSGYCAEANTIQLPAAKKEFAAMLGTTPETLSRKLNKLVTGKVIEVKNRRVIILNMRLLYQIAELAG
ncbi:transcriptional activator FtrB [compost metagenome]